VPADPAAEFAQKLLQLAKAEHDSARQPVQAPSLDLCTN
jgi:hypothetical protein